VDHVTACPKRTESVLIGPKRIGGRDDCLQQN